MNTPTVSFIVPNYNYSQYLGSALQAMLDQTFTNFEVIVIDDASTDNSLEVLKSYQEKDSRIRLVQHQENQGVFKAINSGIQASRGKYIAFSASDDVHLPTFLEKNVRALDEHPHVGLSFSQFATFTSTNPIDITKVWNAQISQPSVLDTKQLIHEIKMQRLWIAGNTVLCRKHLFLEAGGLESKFFSLADWYLFLKMGFQYHVFFIPEVLGALRIHKSSYSQRECLKNKKQAWNNIFMELSERKNSALKAAFIRSHVFNTLGFSFFDYALKSPKAWWFFKHYMYKHFYKRWKQENRQQAKEYAKSSS